MEQIGTCVTREATLWQHQDTHALLFSFTQDGNGVFSIEYTISNAHLGDARRHTKQTWDIHDKNTWGSKKFIQPACEISRIPRQFLHEQH
jgi:hypothetical protein